MKLPKTVYIYVNDGDSDEPFLVAEESLDGLAPDVGERRLVGIYQLSQQMWIKTSVGPELEGG